MPSHQQQKIQLEQEYPCPCHPNGKLQKIALTEAFGCDRCHRIFVLQTDNLAIEELAANYPYKRRYYWDGDRFRALKSRSKGNFGADARWVLWLQCLGVIAVVLVLVRVYAREMLANPLFSLVLSMAIAIVILSAIALWLFDRG